MNDFNWIKDGVRVLMCTLRKKEGGKENRKEMHAQKKISTNRVEFMEIYNEMLANKKGGERIYCTINTRNIDKAIRKLKEIQLDNDYQPTEVRQHFYNDIHNKWISCLMKPSSRESAHFLIDIDNDDKNGLTLEMAENIVKGARVEILHKYSTKNGYHLITEPFNYAKTPLKKWDNVKVDGMVLLAY